MKEAHGLAHVGRLDWPQVLKQQSYIASPGLLSMLELAVAMNRPLLLEGPAGSGKTSLAGAVASVLHRDFVRLQCFEGMDATHALYEWNYHKQFTALSRTSTEDVFSENYLLSRPLLQALRAERGAVLLIDEVDRADEAMEALLLEYLGEWQITIPEWKTVTALIRPITILTSNRTRPLSDALRRRCLYVHLPYPDVAQELEVVHTHVESIAPDAARRIVEAVHELRTWPLLKVPGVAETLDWCRAWCLTGGVWERSWVEATLGCVVKDELDLQLVTQRLDEFLAGFT
ncbi:MoxR family ATPase [Alicyclobacillus fastidiosus]|uniref:MoxR family ATPase n=1 Tax=Alicyclobacillus fastidiosus TaxID=392011 RepID=A0ABY6ZKU3_9BACL|nr:MoxR family ATPase [Alicyclobacillus fastidiosus]WAH42719.1 MoxR family ATPase [Alicyclobacillus fastidiosus]